MDGRQEYRIYWNLWSYIVRNKFSATDFYKRRRPIVPASGSNETSQPLNRILPPKRNFPTSAIRPHCIGLKGDACLKFRAQCRKSDRSHGLSSLAAHSRNNTVHVNLLRVWRYKTAKRKKPNRTRRIFSKHIPIRNQNPFGKVPINQGGSVYSKKNDTKNINHAIS